MVAGPLHTYSTELTWTGNLGTGTDSYKSYKRTHEVSVPGLPTIEGSSDPHFHGDADRWNPEQLLLAALSQCHLLSYLHACAVGGVVVTAYTDRASGVLEVTRDGGGHFIEAVLRPAVTVAEPAMAEKAIALHEQAHRLCFIAASVNFPVRHEPTVVALGQENRV
ncbi:OsmC family protein [Actinacidiphila guanduensis]|uniref:Organic hydroperoxide reductase OsmC/OhrA n=1 Tax=Actinacidiphila guanduensis TaxID=310781 RepID=A0A1H0GYZ7_9ACTN|nr:OsmC family protein [Actinacidiphila guanduensis]SDO12127.1 Organic hydroperoxide reductase OsmC/OhrA [Actinacidiphila guanduensis]